MDPDFVEGHLRLGWVLEQKGMFTEAISESQHALNAESPDPRLIGALGHAYRASGRGASELSA